MYAATMTRPTGVGRGRKPGVTITEPSTFFARLRSAMGDISIEALSRQLEISEKTGRTYNKGIIPKKGTVREKLEKLGRLYKVPIEEPEA